MTPKLPIVLLVLVWLGLVVAAADAQMPLATEYDVTHAQLAISRDGSTLTIRSVAPDAMRLCVEPSQVPGALHCFTVGDLRRGATGRTR